MTIYHGSDTVIEKPSTTVGRRELDFGPGFYLTKLFDQAQRWARRVSVVRASDSPIVSEYIFDVDSLPNEVRILKLENYNQQWLDFVVSSRRGQQPWLEYDIIEGGVANDDVIDTVEDYYSGRITAEQAIGELQFAKPTHQMCIRSQQIVDSYLHFVKFHKL